MIESILLIQAARGTAMVQEGLKVSRGTLGFSPQNTLLSASMCELITDLTYKKKRLSNRKTEVPQAL